MRKVIITGPFRFNVNQAAELKLLAYAQIIKDLDYMVEFMPFGGLYDVKEKCDDFLYRKNGFVYKISHDLTDSRGNLALRLFLSVFRGIKSVEYILKNKDSIIIAYNPGLFFNIFLLFMSVCTRTKVINDFDEWFAPEEFPLGKIGPFYWLSEFNMRFIAKFVNCKIVISKMFLRYYKKNYVTRIPPIATDTIDVSSIFVKDVFSMNLIYAGYPTNKDSLDIVIQSVKVLSSKGIPIKLHIFGPSIQYLTKIYPHLKHLLNTNIFEIYGAVPRTQILSCYKIADASIILRYKTRKNDFGFPTKFVESMANACPVVCNKFSNVSEYIHQGVNGYCIDTIAIEKVCEILLKLFFKEPEERLVMKKQALKTANDYFSMKSQKSTFKILFQHLDS